MFWENLASYVGPSGFAVTFGGILHTHQGDQGVIIPKLNVYRKNMGVAQQGVAQQRGGGKVEYFLTPGLCPGYHPWETVSVYFLPWKNGIATKVTIQELNTSGCDYFTTSEFSGCRFVATNEEVMHVAYFSGGLGLFGYNGASVMRTMAEREAMGDSRPRLRRRAVSISEVNHSGFGPGLGEGVIRTSYRAEIKEESRMKVFGYKFQGNWCFTTLKYVGDGNSDTGVWESLE
jgi:hypothetical protein